MTSDQAKALATLLVGRWGGGAERTALFVLMFSDPGLVYDHALAAVREIVLEDREKCPTPNQILGAYHGAKKAATVSTPSGGMPPCHYCLAEGGWHLDHSDMKYPPREACPPYLPTILVRDDANKVLGPAWGHKPACASHGRQISRKDGHGGWESPYTKEHRESLREWRDRWEGEHAVHAAAMIEQELAAHPSITSFVIAAVNAPPPASVARTATLDPVVAPGPTKPETPVYEAQVRSDVPPPMTPDEEAAFDAGIQF